MNTYCCVKEQRAFKYDLYHKINNSLPKQNIENETLFKRPHMKYDVGYSDVLIICMRIKIDIHIHKVAKRKTADADI